MKPTRKNRKNGLKSTSGSENLGFTRKEQTIKKQRSRKTVIMKNPNAKTTMGAGYSQVYDPFDSPRPEENASSKCPVCFSSPNPSYKTGQNALPQCTQCDQFLCGSCLYPCTSDSATCTNKLCPLVSTLLTCGVVSNPKSKVFGCPEFRACPKCHILIRHESGCKFVKCQSENCNHRFCFICLQDDCRNDKEKYWLLTCKKPRAERQRFMLT